MVVQENERYTVYINSNFMVYFSVYTSTKGTMHKHNPLSLSKETSGNV